MTKREIISKLNTFQTDLKKHYHVSSLQLFKIEDTRITLVVSFNQELTNQVLGRKELEAWLSSVLQRKAHVLIEKYVKQFLSRTEENLVFN